ncbi:MAG: glutathione S-transferase [Gammaproteobacteria bacterium]|nr:glutathione S-transferase [Gammaproteobacteria bacterium]MDH5239966.1 glutathione S-transferase [Gammaproteobacteria bacterium]MDH5262499.1 glutathione S-transferase [Gammaproteobacteria bacterium]
MKFYDCKTAPSPRRVRIFIAEKNIDCETVQVDLGNGEQFSDWYKAINPDCVVPALELDDGSCLSEVLAICDYLESRFPEPALFGVSPKERAQILMWNVKVEQQGLASVADAFRNSARGLANRATTGPVSYAQIPELAERGRSRVEQFFRRLDEQLANNEFIAGDRYSIADISALVTVDFANRLKLSLSSEAMNAKRWYEVVSGRPSAAA